MMIKAATERFSLAGLGADGLRKEPLNDSTRG
jgi:hypothetical protein